MKKFFEEPTVEVITFATENIMVSNYDSSIYGDGEWGSPTEDD